MMMLLQWHRGVSSGYIKSTTAKLARRPMATNYNCDRTFRRRWHVVRLSNTATSDPTSSWLSVRATSRHGRPSTRRGTVRRLATASRGCLTGRSSVWYAGTRRSRASIMTRIWRASLSWGISHHSTAPCYSLLLVSNVLLQTTETRAPSYLSHFIKTGLSFTG